MKKNVKICIVDTIYTLFLFYLINGIKEDQILVVSDGIPESIRKNFKHIYFPKFHNRPQTFVLRLKKIYNILKLRTILFLKTFNKTVEVYGHGHLEFSFPLYEYENSYILEDGLANYLFLNEPNYIHSFKDKLECIFGKPYTGYSSSFGTHKNIKKIYLTKENVPKIIEDKTEIVDLKKLWNMRTTIEQNKILEIFNIQNILNELKDNLTLLLTGCISEEGKLSFEEEINIYKYLIDKQHNKNIVIKTHPRERKNYASIFPELMVINKPFPLEIFKCLDIKISKIVTISSSAALNFVGECDIELYDGETSSKQVNKFIHTMHEEIKKLKMN